MALKYKFNFISWNSWNKDIKLRKNEEIEKYKDELKEDINYWKFLQYEFFSQWKNLKDYANKKNIKIIFFTQNQVHLHRLLV